MPRLISGGTCIDGIEYHDHSLPGPTYYKEKQIHEKSDDICPLFLEKDSQKKQRVSNLSRLIRVKSQPQYHEHTSLCLDQEFEVAFMPSSNSNLMLIV